MTYKRIELILHNAVVLKIRILNALNISSDKTKHPVIWAIILNSLLEKSKKSISILIVF